MKRLFCALLVAAAPMLAQVTPTLNTLPTREFGQPTLINPVPALESAAPNLVEGRELFNPTAIVFDPSASPSQPHVYIADTGNNRVLGWNNADSLAQGNYADLVIGQANLYATFPWVPATARAPDSARPRELPSMPAGTYTSPIPATTAFCAS